MTTAIDISESAAYVHSLANHRLFEHLLRAFSDAAAVRGYQFIEGTDNDPVAPHMRLQLGKAVVRAKLRFVSPLLTEATLDERTERWSEEGDAEQWFNCLMLALGQRGVVIKCFDHNLVLDAESEIRVVESHRVLLPQTTTHDSTWLAGGAYNLEMARLLQFSGKVATAIRMYSAYNQGHDPERRVNAPLDIMWLSDVLHHFERLGMVLGGADPVVVASTCDALLGIFERYEADAEGTRPSKPTFERNASLVHLAEAKDVFRSIRAKALGLPAALGG